jgi:hypothetical protein
VHACGTPLSTHAPRPEFRSRSAPRRRRFRLHVPLCFDFPSQKLTVFGPNVLVFSMKPATHMLIYNAFCFRMAFKLSVTFLLA